MFEHRFGSRVSRALGPGGVVTLALLAACGGRVSIEGGGTPMSEPSGQPSAGSPGIGPKPTRDAGAAPLPKPVLDAGPGPRLDAGSFDAGIDFDAGTDADAGPESDAGQGLDAGTDGGVSNAFDGIYRIADVTLNSAACAAGGSSILATETQPLFIVKKGIFGADNLLILLSCADVTDCRNKAKEEGRYGSAETVDWLFSVSALGTFGTGTTLIDKGTSPTTCTDESLQQASATGEPGVSFRIEVQIRVVPEHAPDADGCSYAAAQQAAGAAECSQFEVITGTFQQAL